LQCAFGNSLWLGNALEARNAIALIEQGFNVVVDLVLNEPPAVLPREIVYLRFPIVDSEGNNESILAAAIKTIALLMELEGLKITVCCSAGLSRSPAIVAAAIALSTNQNPDQTLARIAELTHCDVSPTLWTDISQLCKLLQKN
jgi:protein-tyrosine phosphatase